MIGCHLECLLPTIILGLERLVVVCVRNGYDPATSKSAANNKIPLIYIISGSLSFTTMKVIKVLLSTPAVYPSIFLTSHHVK